MADLHNLLDEVDDALYHDDDDDEQDGDEGPDVLADQQQPPSQDWDDNREELDVPAALEELAQKQLHPELDFDDEQSHVGDDELFDDDAETGREKEDEGHHYSRLKRWWQQELACPELLPLEEDMVKEVTEELERREETIAALSEKNGDIESLLGSVLKVDMDRAKFMLNDLMRTRLTKIQEFPVHMIDLVDRMSEQEVIFALRFAAACFDYLHINTSSACDTN